MTTKSFPVFDCDADVNDPREIWEEYVPESQRIWFVTPTGATDKGPWSTGTTPVIGGGNGEFPGVQPDLIAGPQMNKKIMRKLDLDDATHATSSGRTSTTPARSSAQGPLTEMDLMGIDQVLVIPTMVIMNVPFAENVEGVDALGCQCCTTTGRRDWCDEVPDAVVRRRVPLRVQDPERTAPEVGGSKGRACPVGLIRPIDAG